MESITHPVFGQQIAGLFGVLLQFLAQVSDVDVGVVCAIPVLPVLDVFKDLPEGQLDRPSTHQHPAFLQIDGQVTIGVFCRLFCGQGHLHRAKGSSRPGYQNLGTKGLGHVVNCTTV